MEKLVVSREVAKELKLPKGFESEYVWYRTRFDWKSKWRNWDVSNIVTHKKDSDLFQYLHAPLLGEMLELLLKEIKKNDAVYLWDMNPNNIAYTTSDGDILNERISGTQYVSLALAHIYDNKLVDAVAKLHKWLVDNKYVEVDNAESD
jgi:hypothetical protein